MTLSDLIDLLRYETEIKVFKHDDNQIIYTGTVAKFFSYRYRNSKVRHISPDINNSLRIEVDL